MPKIMDNNAPPGTLVRYNGGEIVGIDCGYTSPAVLTKGWIYEVRRTIEYDWYTKVWLTEVPGVFNSVWFDEAGI